MLFANGEHEVNMRASRPINVFLLLLVSAFAAAQLGCRSVRRGEPIVGPLASSDPQVNRGHLIFQQHCYKCHPGGEGGLGPALNDKLFPTFLMKTQVRAGLGAMPSFHKPDIPAAELDALMKYLIALRRHNVPVANR